VQNRTRHVARLQREVEDLKTEAGQLMALLKLYEMVLNARDADSSE